ncbi:oxidoreductase [Bordetella pertussis]|nr:oxidoreductase [Bordetella pertussis]
MTAPIVGASKPRHLEDAVAALALRLRAQHDGHAPDEIEMLARRHAGVLCGSAACWWRRTSSATRASVALRRASHR